MSDDALRQRIIDLEAALQPFANNARIAGIGGASRTGLYGSKGKLNAARGYCSIEDFGKANRVYYNEQG